MKTYTFIIFKDNKRKSWNCKANSSDDAYDKAYNAFPDADYIELF